MLQNAYFLAKIGADTAENEQQFAEILPKIGNYPTGPIAASSFQRRCPQGAATRRPCGSGAGSAPYRTRSSHFNRYGYG